MLCATSRNVLGSPAEKLVALALPTAAAAIQWNPFLQPMSAEALGMALLCPVDDPAAARQARAQLRRTTLATSLSAIQAVCEFTSHSWIGQVDIPTAVVVTSRDRIVPVSRQLKLARRFPVRRSTRSTLITRYASPSRSCSPRRCSGLLVGRGWPRRA